MLKDQKDELKPSLAAQRDTNRYYIPNSVTAYSSVIKPFPTTQLTQQGGKL